MSRDNVKRTCALLVLAAVAYGGYGLKSRLCPNRPRCSGCPYMSGQHAPHAHCPFAGAAPASI